MTNRVLLSDAGLRISRAGVNVIGAGQADLLFNSECASFPILLRSSVVLNNAFNSISSIYYGKTFSSPPYSSLFWSMTSPTSSAEFYGVSEPGNVSSYVWPVAWNSNSGDSTYFHFKRYTDRIDFYSSRDHSSGAAAAVLTGYITAIVYDYQ